MHRLGMIRHLIFENRVTKQEQASAPILQPAQECLIPLEYRGRVMVFI